MAAKIGASAREGDAREAEKKRSVIRQSNVVDKRARTLARTLRLELARFRRPGALAAPARTPNSVPLALPDSCFLSGDY